MNLQFFSDKSKHAEEREVERNMLEATILDML